MSLISTNISLRRFSMHSRLHHRDTIQRHNPCQACDLGSQTKAAKSTIEGTAL